ncbi:single-stranded DNA-binding protein (plasmid) [Asticcacaulis sp. DW145]|uniref:single-stranded DNA-binding protein n=1 Tax=Asticcacaulis sp. DW145 TaxID=3095608 RepID=UPI003084F403|nr:single-stranded DNA-binding protein [Asticcacaulis sp. DW145]
MNNVVNLIGRLGDNPNCRTLNDGARVANLSIATDDGYKGRDGAWVNRTTWHRLTIWGDKRVAYIEDHYHKGDLIQFTGRLSYSQSERDGVKYNNAELVGSTSLLASASREEKPTAKAQSKSTRKPTEPGYDLDDEIPF